MNGQFQHAHIMSEHNEPRPGGYPGEMLMTGTLTSGIGEGAYFMALDWVVSGFEEKLGFRPYPGTVNLAMGGAAWRHARAELVRLEGIELPPHPGNCGAKCFRVLVEDRHEGALIIPDVPDYPEDKLEIVAPMELRPLLSVSDGGAVHLRLLPG